MAITYVSIAYGDFYREKAVRGLCNSFSLSGTPGKLIVYFDFLPAWAPPEGCVFKILPEAIQHRVKTSDRSFFALTSVKFDILDIEAGATTNGVCWIDADALVLTDLSKVLEEGKINVVSHGSCDPEEIFDCGKGVVVKGKAFAIGGIFYLPRKELVENLLELAAERSSWPEDKTAYWYSDGEQCLLNHIVAANQEEVVWIDDSGYIANWAFLEKRHPYPFDKGINKIRIVDDQFFCESKQFAVLSWSSLTLRRHIKQGFRSMNPATARYLRQKFYIQGNSLKEVFMQYLYTIYDFFNLKIR